MSELKQLPLELKKNGMLYTLFKKGLRAAIYRVTADGEFVAYEVTKIRITPAKEVFGVPYPDVETFPGNEVFGSWAWCCGLCGGSEEAALARATNKYYDPIEDGTFDKEEEVEEEILDNVK